MFEFFAIWRSTAVHRRARERRMDGGARLSPDEARHGDAAFALRRPGTGYHAATGSTHVTSKLMRGP